MYPDVIAPTQNKESPFKVAHIMDSATQLSVEGN